MERNDLAGSGQSIAVSDPVRVDVPDSAPPPPNRSRSKTIYLDTILTSELRDELSQYRDEFSLPAIPEESAAGYFKINAKPAEQRSVAKPNPWAPHRTSTPLLPLIPLDFEPHAPQPTPPASPERMQLALTSILQPEQLADLPPRHKPSVPTQAAKLASSGPADARVVGFLVPTSGDTNGEIFVLRVGRSSVTGEREGGTADSFVIIDRSISPWHATIKVSDAGEVSVLDQFSDHGTSVRRYETGECIELKATAATLFHGDEVRFGDKPYNVCLLAVRA